MGAAQLRVLVTAAGIAKTNAQLASVQGNLNATGSSAGKAGAAMRKGLMVGSAAIGALGGALFKVGESFDDAYDTIRVGTGATGKALESLKGSFKNVIKGVPASFGDASKAVGELNTRLGLTGKPLEARAKQFLELSRITKTDVSTNIRTVTRAFGDWEVKTKDQAGTLDKFFRASQASGASVSELAGEVVKFGAPLRQVGFSLDEATAMFASFEKAGVNTQTMMPGIKQALGSFAKAGVDPKKGLAKAFKDIQSGAMDSEAAVKLFGRRAGTDMVEAVKQGRFKLDDLTKALQKGDTIRKAGKDTMDFAEKWQMFKNKVLVKLEPIAIRVFDGIGVLMEKLPPIAERIGRAIGDLLAPFISVGKAIVGSKTAMLALGAAAGVLLAAWAGFAIVSGISAAIRGMVTVFWALNAAMTANPIGLIVVGLAALVAGFVVAYRESDKFRAIVDAVFSWLKGAASAVFGFVSGVITGAWDVIKSVTSAVWNGIKGFLSGAFNAIKTVVTTYFNAIKAVITTAWNVISTVTSTVWNAIKSVLTTVWSVIKGAASLAWEGIKTVIVNPIRSVVEWGKERFESFKRGLGVIWDAIKSAASTAWNAIKSAVINPVRSAFDWVVDKASGLWERMKRGFSNITEKLGEWAGNLKEVISGVFDKIGDAIRPVKKLIRDVVDAVKDAVEWLGKIKIPKIKLPDLNPFGGKGNGTTVGPPPMSLPANVDGFNPLAAKFGNVVTSGYRPGDDGWHGRNRARDYAGGNMMGFARAMLGFAPKLLELIFTPLGVGVKNGQVVPMSFFGRDVMADHYDHVHVAMQTGGVVKRAGWALVGERGPELAHFPRSSTVYDAGQTRSALSAPAGPAELRIDKLVVYLGDREVTDIVRVEIEHDGRRAHQEFMAGVA